MIHGNPTWSFYFRNMIRGLSSRYRMIAMDHIGCGLSDKPTVGAYDYTLKRRIDDLTQFLQSLDLKDKMTLVVHDWGGMIGAAYALEHPERIRRLVVLNTAAFLPPSEKRLPLRLQLLRRFRTFSTLTVLGLNLFARSALMMAPHKKLPPDVKSGLIAPYNCWRHRIATLMFVRDIPLLPKDESYRVVKAVDEKLHRLGRMPMLICWGLKDFVFDRDYLAEWQRRFPHATVQAYEDAGHYVLEDVPEKIIDSILAFMLTN